MKLKRKIGKKIPVCKAIEGKVPVAWETCKAIPELPYSSSKQVEDYEWSAGNKCGYKVECRISEEEHVVWDTSGSVDDVVFVKATLQNVEWGKNCRTYRYQPKVNVCEKVNELKVVKTGIESKIVFEMVSEFGTLTLEKCKIRIKFKGKSGNKTTKKEKIQFDKEYSERIDDPTTRNGQQIEQIPIEKDQKSSWQINYKLSEEEPEVWGLEFIIPDLVYEHALLQNVEFEWGTWGRPVKLRPDVRGKEVENEKVKKAEETEIVFEITKPFPAVNFDNCKVTEPERVKIMSLIIKECKKEKELPNFIYKNPKFFCKSCNEHICNNCFTTDCMDHDVQWLGNATFRCESPYHKQI